MTAPFICDRCGARLNRLSRLLFWLYPCDIVQPCKWPASRSPSPTGKEAP